MATEKGSLNLGTLFSGFPGNKRFPGPETGRQLFGGICPVLLLVIFYNRESLVCNLYLIIMR